MNWEKKQPFGDWPAGTKKFISGRELLMVCGFTVLVNFSPLIYCHLAVFVTL